MTRRRRLGAVVGAALLISPIALASGGTLAGEPGVSADAQASVPATRLEPPAGRSAPTYPAGWCDRMSGGLALLPGQTPEHFGVAGWSVEGREIWAEHWGPIDGPQVLVVSGVHGNECAPDLLVQTIRRHPPARYGIWLVPLLNPDGRVHNTRENTHRIDLNADGHARSEPETQVLMELTEQLHPVLTVHVHSPNGFVGWFGTGRYVIADPVTSVAPVSYAIATRLSKTSSLRLDGAGYRYGTDSFLWQGQFAVWPTQEALLVELFAISNLEAPIARPRPPTHSADEIVVIADALLAALDAVLAPAG